jgi:Arc/MetJ family transcription regulator
MRTTITIDDDLFAAVKMEAARTHRTIGSIVEEAVRERFGRGEGSQSGPRVDFSYPAMQVAVSASYGHDLEANGWVTPTGMRLIPAKRRGRARLSDLPGPKLSYEEVEAALADLKGEW